MTRYRTALLATCVATAVISVIAVSACSKEGQASLNRTSWKLTGWAEGFSWPPDVTITAAFDEAKVSGNSGVNSYSGPYKLGGGGAFSAGPIASTMMAGPEAAMKAEAAYVHRLEAAKSHTLDGATLVLKDADGMDSLTFTAAD